MTGPYAIGTSIELSTEYRRANGDLFDPSGTRICKLRDPGGGVRTYTYLIDSEFVRDAQGLYHVDVLPDLPGSWRYQFLAVAGSDSTASHPRSFMVEASL